MAWTAEFASDADFIHALGGFFHGSGDIERGHRAIFDTIYKGSVAAVFIRANLTWYLNGQERRWWQKGTQPASGRLPFFQNTLITPEAVPTLADTLAKAHPYKGNTPVK